MQTFHMRQLSAGKRLVLSLFLVCVILLLLLVLYVNLDHWLKHRPAYAIHSAESVMDGVIKAWHDEDAELFLSLMSDDFVVYDARQVGFSINMKATTSMMHNPDWWNGFDISPGAYFVAQDGRFAVFTSILFSASDSPGLFPIAALYAIKDGKLAYAYDYYGGIMSITQPPPVVQSRKLNPRSVEARENVDETTRLVDTWFRAYNERDPATYLACFSDAVRYVDLVKPEWRVLSKNELAADVTERFQKAAFTAQLAAPYASPLEIGYLVSADGRYAAAQGQYKDDGIDAVPMLVVLELADGLIIREYNYMDIALQP